MAPRKQKSVREELKKQTMVGADQKERKLADHFEEDDFDIEKDKSNIFVRHDALLRVAKKIWGIKSRYVNTIQSPTKENDWCAVVQVVYIFMAGKLKKDGGERRPEIEWSDVGDCRAKTANPGFKNYTTALAATRASSRALRFALGLEVCTKEGFHLPYELSDKKSNAELCATMGNVFLSHRLFLAKADACYIDVLEQALYNGVLVAGGLDGVS